MATSMKPEDGFKLLQNLVSNKNPFFVGRLSGIETRLCGLKLSNKRIDRQLFMMMLVNAGIYMKTEEDVNKYIDLYLSSVDSCDNLGVWDGLMYTQALDFYNYAKNRYSHKYFPAQSLEPFYYFNQPYYKPLFVNKNILIITSHEKTVLKQISKIDSIFPKKIFDNCQFIVVRAPIQSGHSCDGILWFEHYKELQDKIRNLKFDVALVGCGGFGMPICNFIFTEMKSSVMFVGGSIQLFFGIIGSRWLSNDKVKELINDSWCWPLDEDKPNGYKYIEGGCYW